MALFVILHPPGTEHQCHDIVIVHMHARTHTHTHTLSLLLLHVAKSYDRHCCKPQRSRQHCFFVGSHFTSHLSSRLSPTDLYHYLVSSARCFANLSLSDCGVCTLCGTAQQQRCYTSTRSECCAETDRTGPGMVSSRLGAFRLPAVRGAKRQRALMIVLHQLVCSHQVARTAEPRVLM